MWKPPDAVLRAVTVSKATVIGCSVVPIDAEAFRDYSQVETDVPLCAHSVLPGSVKVTTRDGAMELRLLDGLGTPLLEWRFEGMPYKLLVQGRHAGSEAPE